MKRLLASLWTVPIFLLGGLLVWFAPDTDFLARGAFGYAFILVGICGVIFTWHMR